MLGSVLGLEIRKEVPQMSKFGSSIRYILVDLINIYKQYGAELFLQKRDEYLAKKRETGIEAYYNLSAVKIEKILNFIINYIDSLTCENEMKMECYFNQHEPAFIDDEVNRNLFNFEFSDKIYKFAQEYVLDMRIHTIVWHRHIPKQLIEYIEDRSPEDRKKLTLDFIRVYMMCLKERYPKCYCVDVINEMAADPAELRYLKEENKPLYEYDDEGIRIDFWYKVLGKHYYIDIFRMARDIFGDDVKLFYNDNNEGNKEKQKTYKVVFNNFKKYEQEHGVKIFDGFGMQSHFWGDETKEFMTEMFDFYTSQEIDIQITEFDVSSNCSKEQQYQIFEDFIDVIKDYNISVFIMWGLNDELSWLAEEEPLLVDKNYELKGFAGDYIKHFSNKRKTIL